MSYKSRPAFTTVRGRVVPQRVVLALGRGPVGGVRVMQTTPTARGRYLGDVAGNGRCGSVAFR
jgi:hypothetical protein